MNDRISISKKALERQRTDLYRPLRVVKCIEFPYILEDSPIEVEEGYIVSDRETCDVFASFVFKNVSEKPIRKLTIRLSFYLNQNIPYRNVEFVYCHDDLTFGMISKNGKDYKLKESNAKRIIETSESFGTCVFIPIPERYFSKIEVTLVSVEYSIGEVQELNLLVTGSNRHYSDLDNISKLVYTRVNIYQSAEGTHPTVVMPQFGNQVWLCCCGNKNPNKSEVCEKCGREKEYQKKSLSEEAIAFTKEQITSDPREVAFHDKSKYKQNKYLENEAEIQKKISAYEKAMQNIALEEEYRQRKMKMFVPKLLLCFAAVLLFRYVLEFVIQLIIDILGQ